MQGAIQTKTLKKLIKVVEAWADKNSKFKQYNDRKIRVKIIQEILQCSKRTAWDYDETFREILSILGIAWTTHSLNNTEAIKINRWLDITKETNFTEFSEYDCGHNDDGSHVYFQEEKDCLFNASERLKDFHDRWKELRLQLEKNEKPMTYFPHKFKTSSN